MQLEIMEITKYTDNKLQNKENIQLEGTNLL
jgi:hypothetical protein